MVGQEGLSANVNMKGKIMSTVSNLSNIGGGLPLATRRNGLALYLYCIIILVVDRASCRIDGDRWAGMGLQ